MMNPDESSNIFEAAEWYDRGINWKARLARELPVLTDVLGSPGAGGVVDAGCGPGHQAVALTQRGYTVTALDVDSGMIERAALHAEEEGVDMRRVNAPYELMPESINGDVDGIYCLANALASAGSESNCRQAIHAFSSCLRPGGRLFVQILNFRPMRHERPCVRGPRIAHFDGREYVSVRHFTFSQSQCEVMNVTLWNDGQWRQRSNVGRLYPIDVEELATWCKADRLTVDSLWGGYDRARFDADRSVDLILIATRQTD